MMSARDPFRQPLRASHGADRGKAWVSYMPNSRVVGISKLARVLKLLPNACKSRKSLQPKLPTSSTMHSSRAEWESSSELRIIA